MMESASAFGPIVAGIGVYLKGAPTGVVVAFNVSPLTVYHSISLLPTLIWLPEQLSVHVMLWGYVDVFAEHPQNSLTPCSVPHVGY
jgi:hypothetical protein